jgi:hypothetical protein
MDDPKYMQNGKITDDGLSEVKRRLPHADLAELEKTREPALIPDLFAVQDIVDYIERRMA